MRIEKKVARATQNHGKVCHRVRGFEHASGGLAVLPELLPAAGRDVFPSPHTSSLPEKKKQQFSAG